MDFGKLHDMGLTSHWISYLDWETLIVIEQVCKLFLKISNLDHIWRHAARSLFAGKYAITPLCFQLLTPGNTRIERRDLDILSFHELKDMCQTYQINCDSFTEKNEIAMLLHNHQTKEIYDNECLSKFALRLAWSDRTRRKITFEELCSFEWRVR